MQAGGSDTAPTVASLLQTSAEQLKGSSLSARLDAEVLLAHALGWQRARLYGESGQTVRPEIVQRFAALIEERQTGRPVAQLVGTREFWSLELTVTPDTLVPRQETEMLVELALNRIPQGSTGRVLELGTGSGAVALALASERPGLEIVATDLSEEALKVARYNAGAQKRTNIEFRFGDWFKPVAGERILLDRIGSAREERAVRILRTALSGRSGFQAIQQEVAQVQRAIQLRNDLLERLPYYVRWQEAVGRHR